MWIADSKGHLKSAYDQNIHTNCLWRWFVLWKYLWHYHYSITEKKWGETLNVAFEYLPSYVWNHRSSSPLGLLPCFPLNFKHNLLIRQSTGAADHLTLCDYYHLKDGISGLSVLKSALLDLKSALTDLNSAKISSFRPLISPLKP